MKKLSVLIILTLTVISFQNCAQRNFGSDANSTANPSTGITANQISANGASKVVLWNPDRSQYLDVDMSNGKMTSYENFGEIRGESYCLTADETYELKTILSVSDICEPQVDPASLKDRTCTMLYKFPYASILKDSKEYRLGEMNTGCDEPVDLCGSGARSLKDFAAAVIASIDNRTCPQ